MGKIHANIKITIEETAPRINQPEVIMYEVYLIILRLF